MVGPIGRLLIVSLTLAPWLNAQERPLAFVDVNVVSMDKEQILPPQTVVVVSGRIAQVGPSSSVKVPRGALKIEGRGKFLMPGLADMHVHFMRPVPPSGPQPLDPQTGIIGSASSNYQQENQALALLFVANGITSVRNMWGHPEVDALKDRILRGELIGPFVYSTGPLTDGVPPMWAGSRTVTTQAEAEQAVKSDRDHGYVGVKVYSLLSLHAYHYIVDAAAKEGIPVVGHVPDSVGLNGAIEAHQASVEHLTGFEEALESAELSARADSNQSLLELAARIKAAGMWNCPTIVLAQIMSADPAHWVTQRSFAPPGLIERYERSYPYQPGQMTDPKILSFRLAAVRALHDVGAGLLAGTDAYKPNVIPGFSLYEELGYFVQAGLSPYDAIRAATSDAARFLHQENEFGVVAVGRRADLLLLTANPLLNVQNLQKRVGVMLRGRWMPEVELQEHLKNLRDRN
jgi:imidazolonepropionase-like amidohydrolase